MNIVPEPSSSRRWLFAVFLVAPLITILAKLGIVPAPVGLDTWFTLADLPERMQGHVEFIMYVPLGAVVVAFFRLTLGMPVLGLFRPILLAIALRIIGIPIGLAFLTLVLGVTVLMLPLLKGAHYYSRVPVQLSIAANFLLLPLIAGRWWHDEWLQRLAHFPIIPLALICEGFTKTLDDKGFAEAAWPTANTILLGILISQVTRIPGAMHLLLRFPEVLVAQVGVVLVIGEYLHFEFLKDTNPFATRRPPAEIRKDELVPQSASASE